MVSMFLPAHLVPLQLVQPDDLRQLRPHRRLHDRHRVGQQHRDQVRRQDGRAEGGQERPHRRLAEEGDPNCSSSRHSDPIEQSD